MNEHTPRGALLVVGLVFVTVLVLWFLVLGLVQARG
jgi:Cytochrome c oxidase subunit IIa family